MCVLKSYSYFLLAHTERVCANREVSNRRRTMKTMAYRDSGREVNLLRKVLVVCIAYFIQYAYIVLDIKQLLICGGFAFTSRQHRTHQKYRRSYFMHTHMHLFFSSFDPNFSSHEFLFSIVSVSEFMHVVFGSIVVHWFCTAHKFIWHRRLSIMRPFRSITLSQLYLYWHTVMNRD